MADTRINALSTATVSLSDDFLPIDGTTAGTKKLSAYNPSFGGNATVGGTLTVNGTTASVGAGTGSIISKLNGAAGSYKLSIYQSAGVDRWYAGLAAGAESGSDGGAPYSIVALTDAGAVIDNALLITRAAGGSITTPRPVSISASTASTSTSSGALVVSGGVGVGGAANIGGALTVSGTGGIGASASGDVGFKVLSSLTSGSFQYGIYSYPTVNAGTADGGLFGVRAGTSVAVTTAFALRAFTPTLDSGASIASNIGIRVENQGATGITNAFGIDILAQSGASTTNVGLRNAGTTLLTNTTDSTTKSDGALVVSGGVGVEKNIIAGSGIAARGTLTLPAAWTGAYGIGLEHNNATSTSRIFFGDGTGYSLKFVSRASSTTTDRMTLTDTGNLTVVGSLTTGAPSGGTAAAWKLGTVATVSPTSPNRTIEVDIGGTIYYIHAKTTNN
jgi:hypothetical protein